MTSPAGRVRPAAIVVLAAGEGTRMRSGTAKVLHELCGRSLVGHVLGAARALDPEHLVVVVGHQREQVAAHVTTVAEGVRTVVQSVQRGTGHAVRCALDTLGELDGTVMVLNGDTPLLTAATVRGLLEAHVDAGAAATVLTAVVPDPTGLGRIVREQSGRVTRIVEERDASAAERAIHEINSGVFAFDARLLRTTLTRLRTDNDQGQEYLTDVVGLLTADARPVVAVAAADHRETLGCNDRAELARLRALLRDRLVDRWMRDGVTVIDPATVWPDVDVVVERDAVIHPDVQLLGATVVGPGSHVGPDCTLVDTRVGADARVVRAHCDGAVIGDRCSIGPYAYLRPGTVLAAGVKVGTYVETKNATLGEGAKVPHLTYVGDATIGEGTNIGASTVFVNYDGVRKHRTVVGDHCRTGADNTFVAPVSIGDGAYTAAGSVVTDDVPPGAMAVARARQRNVRGWVERRRAGTASAAAARAAAGTAATRAAGKDTDETRTEDPAGSAAQPVGENLGGSAARAAAPGAGEDPGAGRRPGVAEQNSGRAAAVPDRGGSDAQR